MNHPPVSIAPLFFPRVHGNPAELCRILSQRGDRDPDGRVSNAPYLCCTKINDAGREKKKTQIAGHPDQQCMHVPHVSEPVFAHMCFASKPWKYIRKSKREPPRKQKKRLLHFFFDNCFPDVGRFRQASPDTSMCLASKYHLSEGEVTPGWNSSSNSPYKKDKLMTLRDCRGSRNLPAESLV